MNVRKQDVWALQIIDLLIHKYDYRLVATNMSEQKDEIWLANASQLYPVVRVSPNNLSVDRYDYERIHKIHDKILDMIQKEFHPLLAISISEEMPSQNESGIVFYCITEDYRSSDYLDTVFPELVNLLQPIEEIRSSFDEISKTLKRHQLMQLSRAKPKVKKKINTTMIIVIICMVIYIFLQYVSKLYQDTVLASIIGGALYKTLVYGNYEVWRLITYAFVHVDLLHIASNMYALYNLGSAVESFYGKKKFLIALFSSIVVSAVFVLVGDSNIVTLGMSGGVFGLLGMWLVHSFQSGLIHNKRIRNSFIQILLINLLISLMPDVSLLGHLGGFICGLFLGLLFDENDRWKELKKNAIISVCILVMVISYIGFTNPKQRPLYGGTDMKYIQALRDFGMNDFADITTENLVSYYVTVEGN